MIVYGTVEYIGGLASEGNRRSIVCLSSGSASLPPTALALVVNVCVIPGLALLFWVAFWTAKGLRRDPGARFQYLAKRCLLSVMVLWYITFVPVLKAALSVGLCVDVHDVLDPDSDGTTSYWAVDTSIKCGEGIHSRLKFFLVLCYVCPVYLGLLAFFVGVLRQRTDEGKDDQGADADVEISPHVDTHNWVFETLGFLFRGYRLGRCRYWEVVVVMRKVAVTFLAFCANRFDSATPVSGIAYVITFAIVAHILAMPYRERFNELNKFEVAALFVSQMTTQAATMLKDEGFPHNYFRELLTVACVVLNIVTFFVLTSYLLKFTSEYLKHGLFERRVHLHSNAGVFGVFTCWIGFKVKSLVNKLRRNRTESQD